MCICVPAWPLVLDSHWGLTLGEGYFSLSWQLIACSSSSGCGTPWNVPIHVGCLLTLSLFRSRSGSHVARISWCSFPVACRRQSHSRRPCPLALTVFVPSSLMFQRSTYTGKGSLQPSRPHCLGTGTKRWECRVLLFSRGRSWNTWPLLLGLCKLPSADPWAIISLSIMGAALK